MCRTVNCGVSPQLINQTFGVKYLRWVGGRAHLSTKSVSI